MAMVDVGHVAAIYCTGELNAQVSWLGRRAGGRPAGWPTFVKMNRVNSRSGYRSRWQHCQHHKHCLWLLLLLLSAIYRELTCQMSRSWGHHIAMLKGQMSRSLDQHIAVLKGRMSRSRGQHIAMLKGQMSSSRGQHIAVFKGQTSRSLGQHLIIAVLKSQISRSAVSISLSVSVGSYKVQI